MQCNYEKWAIEDYTRIGKGGAVRKQGIDVYPKIFDNIYIIWHLWL